MPQPSKHIYRESLEPTEYEAPPYRYLVPSNFNFVETFDTTDRFRHPIGTELEIQRLVLESERRSPIDPVAILRDRASDLGTPAAQKPVLLETGFAMLTYRERDPDDPDLTWDYCELCRPLGGSKLGVIRFGMPRFESDSPGLERMLHWHAARDFARGTRMIGDPEDAR